MASRQHHHNQYGVDVNCLKRSFAQVAGPKSSYFQDVQCDLRTTAMSVQMLNELSNAPRISPTKRRSCSLSRPELPVPPASPSLSASFPSFMSAFADSSTFCHDERRDGCLGTRIADAHPVPKIPTSTSGSATSAITTKAASANTTASLPSITHHLPRPQTAGPTPFNNTTHAAVQFVPRENISIASESTDSSPTTTISTFDSPAITEASPSSSPESPSSVTPLHSLKPMARITNGDRLAAQLPSEPFSRTIPPFSVQKLPESPTRRARNLKNLSLKLPPTSTRQSIATAPIKDTSHNISAPASPIQANPRSLRRKPPNLKIQTPSFERSFSSNIAEIVPPTPHTRPTLRHIESSPSLQSIMSPIAPTKPTLALPGSFFQTAKRPMPGTFEDRVSPDRPTLSSQPLFSSREALHELAEEEDRPTSRESRRGSDKGYPDGPVLIYDSGLYLYLEPSCDEASNFDVVVNVAKEVANPFHRVEEKQDTVVSVWKATLPDAQRQSVVEPNTALSEMSFKSALEFQPSDTESPTTPKAGKHEPEYIHVPWDHNSEILDDLYPLCQLIDDRISKHKKVLIHCQLGVSRSASLVIAYGLYKNQDKDFNAMYSIVKERSCWVGPNMSLIYQLTDFRSRVQQGGPSQPPPAHWFNHTDVKMTDQPRAQAPVPASHPNRPPVPLFDQAQGDSTHSSSKTFTNPFSWTTSNNSRRSASPRPLPLREKYQTIHSLRRTRYDTNIPSHRTLSRTSAQMDLVMQDVPSTPSLFSPRAAEFWTTPFSRTVAGDLAFRDPIEPSIPRHTPSAADPRSPPQRREPLIMRNIDEFL
ncbi:hypothetical protein FQN51_000805 [Onygenales sp. PD_10]|nr:hypothetical protein FQN51_000805 [Onygenales sp. PD_10]